MCPLTIDSGQHTHYCDEASYMLCSILVRQVSGSKSKVVHSFTSHPMHHLALQQVENGSEQDMYSLSSSNLESFPNCH